MRRSVILEIVPALLVILASVHAAAGSVWTVAKDGSGDFERVSDACGVAVSGDTIQILPGSYGPDVHTLIEEKALAIIGIGAVPSDVSLQMTLTFGYCDGTSVENLRFRDVDVSAIRVWGGSIAMRRCRFEGNGGDVHIVRGGAIYGTDEPIISVEDCVFVRNEATGTYGRGGAIYSGSAFFTVRDCVFFDNSATVEGGAIYAGNESVIERCVFYRNAAGGGAAVSVGFAVSVSNCTFLRNRVTDGFGGAIEAFLWDTVIDHCIVAGTVGGAALVCPGSAITQCCCLWDNEHGDGDWWGCGILGSLGNYSADPMFCDPEICDVGLLPGSPCLPGNHGGYECGLVGAYGEGCGEVPVRTITWGGIKALYR